MPAAPAWLAVLVAAVIVLAFAPLLHAQALSLWNRPHYQFFPLALFGGFALAWSYGRNASLPLVPGNHVVTLAGITVAWVLLAIAEVFYSPMLAGVAALLLLGAVIVAIGGAALFRTLLPAWAYLWIIVPLPIGLDRRLVVALQSWTSQWSSNVLDTLGVMHLLDGNVVEISGRRLLVEEACSGISSLFSVLACTLFLILWLRRPWPRALLLITAAIGWVLAANVLRVVAIAYAYDRWAIDLAAGLKHEVLGFACFAIAVLLIWSTDRFFLFLIPRRPATIMPASPAPVASVQAGTQGLAAIARLLSLPMAIAFGLLLLLHVATYGLPAAEGEAPLLPAMARLGENTLPNQLAGWKRDRFYTEERDLSSVYGAHSGYWVYKLNQRTTAIAVDYPFPRYHLLDECYLNQGWQIERHQDYSGDAASPDPQYWVQLKLKKAALRTGTVLYCECNQAGTYLQPEGPVLRAAVKRFETAIDGWRQRFKPADEGLHEQGPVYQFQLFIEGNRPLTTEEQQSVQQLFREAIRALRKEMYSAG
jgi:exosortase